MGYTDAVRRVGRSSLVAIKRHFMANREMPLPGRVLREICAHGLGTGEGTRGP
jgi:hypothetical protein